MVPQFYRGKEGRPIQVAANYLKLDVAPGKGVFEYEVSYEPRIDNRNHRFKLLNQHRGTGILGPEKVMAQSYRLAVANRTRKYL